MSSDNLGSILIRARLADCPQTMRLGSLLAHAPSYKHITIIIGDVRSAAITRAEGAV